MKTCTKCKLDKELKDYYYDYKKADKKHPECKSCFNRRMKETRKSTTYKIRFNPYQKEWQRKYRKTAKYKEWRSRAILIQSNIAKELKKKIVDYYGGRCHCCGIKEIYFLSIDHINNDGYKMRGNRKNRPSGYLFYKKIIREDYPNDLQILCFNCNIAKNHNGGECPHKMYAIIRNDYK